MFFDICESSVYKMKFDFTALAYSDCYSHSLALFDLLIVYICSTMAFPLLGNSNVVVSVSIDFPSNSKRDVPFECITYDCSCTDWGSSL